MSGYLAHDPPATELFHITDVSNLPSIINGGFLLSDALLAKQGGPATGIGYSHIKQRRMTVLRVACTGNRFVGEFVPFYFCPRSVMLYTVNSGSVPGRPKGCQRTVVHLVTTIRDVTAAATGWAFSDQGANGSYPPNFWNSLNQLPNLDWNAIGLTYWGNRGPQKSAEFLVEDRVPWVAINEVACFDDAVRNQVLQQLQNTPNAPTVTTRRNWYFP